MPEGEQPQSSSISEEIPMGFPVSPDLLMWEMSASDTLKAFHYSMKGLYWDESERKWIKFGKPLMNDEGLRMIVGFVADFLSKDKILTDLDSDQINLMIKTSLTALVYHIRMNYRRYAIDKTNADIIVRRIEAFMVANLNRSIGGRTLDHQKPMIKRVESITPERQKDGFLSWVPGFGGR